MAIFQCDDTLHIKKIEGEIADRLGCDSSELYEHSWHPFLYREDWPVIDRMGAALAAKNTGRYDVRAVSRSGERLYLAIRTLVVLDRQEPSTMAGVIDLVHSESSRHYVDLGRVAP